MVILFSGTVRFMHVLGHQSSPSVKSNFASLQQLHSIAGNFKEFCSNMGYIEKFH